MLALPAPQVRRSGPHPDPYGGGEKPDGATPPIGFREKDDQHQLQPVWPFAFSFTFIEQVCELRQLLQGERGQRSGGQVVS